MVYHISEADQIADILISTLSTSRITILRDKPSALDQFSHSPSSESAGKMLECMYMYVYVLLLYAGSWFPSYLYFVLYLSFEHRT